MKCVRATQGNDILRALRKQVLLAFEHENIALGTPTSTIVMQQASDPTASPAQTSLTGG